MDVKIFLFVGYFILILVFYSDSSVSCICIMIVFLLLSMQWRYVLHLPESNKKGVTCITGILLSENEAMFASTSSDGVVNVWEMIFPPTPGGSHILQMFMIDCFSFIYYMEIEVCYL